MTALMSEIVIMHLLSFQPGERNSKTISHPQLRFLALKTTPVRFYLDIQMKSVLLAPLYFCLTERSIFFQHFLKHNSLQKVE